MRDCSDPDCSEDPVCITQLECGQSIFPVYDGWCPPDMVCTVVMEEDYTYCECQLEEEPTTTIPEETTTVPPATEFATGSLAAAILLVTPAFAYLLVRKRH
ncbi:MAG: hypothetical protein B5M53_07160 [Candidatus Cloacimonas sp. 4484_209]|nr:MAG: hypothetical protein B5M53_07160 [Candidatus Cloacimonas sp. 4484_209]